MLKQANLYYFSPTGGTKKAAEVFAEAIAENTTVHNLNHSSGEIALPDAELTIVAAPVFGGRIPAVVTEKLQGLRGSGKAVVLAVYGNRAYDDALLELKNTMEAQGFTVIAAAALLAQHSVVPKIAAGRPDAQDVEKIKDFAAQVLAKLEANGGSVTVPGDVPYKDHMATPFAPLTADHCIGCRKCVRTCPVGSITMENGKSIANPEKCILCMGCIAACPVDALALPAPVQQAMDEKLGVFTDRKEPEFYL